MKIFACSDVHGAAGAVLGCLRGESGIDAIVLAGDITTKGTPDDVERFLSALKLTGLPVIAVAGNMDFPRIEETLKLNDVSVNGTGIIIGEVGFFGVSASPPTPFGTPYEISEEEILKRAEQGWATVRHAPRKVFIPHAPPANTALDRTWMGHHVGSRAVREFVQRRGPDLVICGHIHESRGMDRLGATLMVNCGAAGDGFYAVASVGESLSVELKEAKP